MTDFVAITQNGARQLTPADLNAAFANLNLTPDILGAVLSNWFPTLPTTPPTQSNQPYNNGGFLCFSGYAQP